MVPGYSLMPLTVPPALFATRVHDPDNRRCFQKRFVSEPLERSPVADEGSPRTKGGPSGAIVCPRAEIVATRWRDTTPRCGTTELFSTHRIVRAALLSCI